MHRVVQSTIIVIASLAAIPAIGCSGTADVGGTYRKATNPEPPDAEAPTAVVHDAGPSAKHSDAGGARMSPDGGIGIGGPGGDTTKLPCGATTCFLPLETCCVTDVPGSGFAFACVVGACPQVAREEKPKPESIVTALKCSSSANCGPGTVCCVSKEHGEAASQCNVECKDRGAAQLCDPRDVKDDCVGPKATCTSDQVDEWGLPAGFGTCSDGKRPMP